MCGNSLQVSAYIVGYSDVCCWSMVQLVVLAYDCNHEQCT